MTSFTAARALLADGARDRAFPAAVVEVGRRDTVFWREAFGALTYEPGAPATSEHTIFDLASLTKVLATTPLVMRSVERSTFALDEPLGRRFRHWRGDDRAAVTIGDLLAHCSGLNAYEPLYKDHAGRTEFEYTICTRELEYTPRTRSLYSDLGFMLVGFLLEDTASADLAAQLVDLAPLFGGHPLAFRPPPDWRVRTAPTEVDPWRGRLLIAEAHDENAWALGGAAGHAGLFGTAAAVGSYARIVLQTFRESTMLGRTETMRSFATRTADVPGSSRALGWDTMLPISSCGARMSARAIGHTGFTGTSLWIDPERDVYVALLTNRVHPTRENEALKRLRPAVHNAIMDAIT